MINLTINEKSVQVKEGSTILEAAQSLGIRIPTLCYHKALSPFGSCRLCLAEIIQGKRKMIKASCQYKAEEGVVVETDSERVLKNRKIMIELLLARCPESEEIIKLAEELGVNKTRIINKNKDCTLCGLCVRMCEERMGIGVMSFINRGSKREVKPPFETSSQICQTCGACASICPTGRIDLAEVSKNKPVPILSEYNMGLVSRPAIYISYPQAIPNKATIDNRHCVHLLTGKNCEVCKEFCEADAIDYGQKEEKADINVGAIVVSAGYEPFDANKKKELGHGRYPNVVSAIEFERILSATGPYSGKVKRPSDEKSPKKIAFIQCIGSREVDHDYCSSACCMFATKEAVISMEHEPGVECTIFFIDMRAFGKGFDAYYERAKELGVKYIRCKPSSIKEDPKTENLKIQYQADDGEIKIDDFSLVVLSTGFEPSKEVKNLSDKLNIKLNEFDFCKTSIFNPVGTSREGIFACGPFTEPKDIPETVIQSSGAASKALTLLKDARGTMIEPKEYPP